MGMYAGLDAGGKRTAVWVVNEVGKIVFRGMVDTHPRMLAAALKRFEGKLAKVGLESGPFTPHLFRLASGDGLSNGMHGRAPGGRCDQEPTDQERQGRRLRFGRDAADGLVFAGARQVVGQPSP